MKRLTKIIINIVIILIALLTYINSIKNTAIIGIQYLRYFEISSFVMFIALILLIATKFYKYTLKEMLKNKTITIIISFMVLSILFTYLTPVLFYKYDPTSYIISKEKHGMYYKVNKEQLKTIEDVKNYKIDESLQAKPEDYKYQELFNKDKINNVYLTINRFNYGYLLQNAKTKPYVLLDKIKINDYTIENVGIKTKGNSTNFYSWESTTDRFSYTVNFSKYVNEKNGYEDKQNLLGLKKISFNNMLGDNTFLKEYLSYYLLTEMNLPTPDYNLTNLYINNEYKGIYFMVEGIDKALTKRTLGNGSDFTFKAEIPGSALTYNKKLDKYLKKDGEFDFSEIIEKKNGKIKLPYDNDLQDYNGIWENDPDSFKEIVDYLPAFFKTLKELNELSNMKNKNTKEYEKRLAKIIDIDLLARYWAVNTFIVNSDSYYGKYPTNYVINMTKDGYMTILPWDYNLSFGGFYYKTATDVINVSIDNPLYKTTFKERPLLNVILGNKKFKKLYEKYLNDLLIIATEGGTTSDGKTYEKDNLKNIINSKKEYIVSQQAKDKDSFTTPENIELADNYLIELINLRSKSIRKQLANKKSNLKTDIDLDSIGTLRIFE